MRHFTVNKLKWTNTFSAHKDMGPKAEPICGRDGPFITTTSLHILPIRTLLAIEHELKLDSGSNIRHWQNSCHWSGTCVRELAVSCIVVMCLQSLIVKFDTRVDFQWNFKAETQLSNLWWMPNSVSKGFDSAMKTGSSRRFKRHPTTYKWVSSWLPFTVD